MRLASKVRRDAQEKGDELAHAKRRVAELEQTLSETRAEFDAARSALEAQLAIRDAEVGIGIGVG